MSKRISKEEKKDLEDRIMEYARTHGSLCVNTIKQITGYKWETVNTTVLKLASEGKLYQIADTNNPKMYSIWPDTAISHTRRTVLATLQERDSDGNNNCLYARLAVPHVRAAEPTEVRKSVGFVCHPTTKGRDVDIDFVRAHWRGSFVVEVKKRGQLIESWKLDGQPITGSWKVTPMSGNLKCDARIHIGDDPDAYTATALTRKDGTISKLNIYVHSRFIYYKASDRTAMAEFFQQIEDVTGALSQMGWEFGEVIDKGKVENLHRAMNSIKLGMIAMQAAAYEDKDTDMVHFDRSHGTPEAEVYGASEEANATIDFLTNPLPVINGLGERMTAMESAMIKMGGAVEKMGGAIGTLGTTMTKVLEVLVQQGEILVKLAEANGQSVQYVAPKEEDGIAYGRANL